MSHDLFGHTRTTVKRRHALITRDGYVPSALPGWEAAECFVVISGGLGARLNQWFANLPGRKKATGDTADRSLFLYVLEGAVTVNGEALEAGGFAYLPPGTGYEVRAGRASRLMAFEKVYEPLAGEAAPGARFGQSQKVQGEAFLGDPDAVLQTLLPTEMAFDMAVNIFTYQPGATLPFVETHIMEHGLLMLRGQGVYRLEESYYPVREGDVIWMAPWCPQWYVSMGKEPSAYIYYKDVNRTPQPAAFSWEARA